MLYVITQQSDDYPEDNKVLAIRATLRPTLTRMAEIADKKVLESNGTDTRLARSASKDGKEIYLTRAEFEGEGPLYVLSYQVVLDVDTGH